MLPVAIFRSKYQLMHWRHPTSLDTGPWYRGNQFIKLYIHSPMVLPHLPPIHSPLCSLALLHPASVERKAASRVLTAPSPPTSSVHKSSVCSPCFSAPSRSAPSPDSIFLCIALSCSLLLHLQPSYSNFVGSIDENASSRSRVCGLVYPWSAACEPYYP